MSKKFVGNVVKNVLELVKGSMNDKQDKMDTLQSDELNNIWYNVTHPQFQYLMFSLWTTGREKEMPVYEDYVTLPGTFSICTDDKVLYQLSESEPVEKVSHDEPFFQTVFSGWGYIGDFAEYSKKVKTKDILKKCDITKDKIYVKYDPEGRTSIPDQDDYIDIECVKDVHTLLIHDPADPEHSIFNVEDKLFSKDLGKSTARIEIFSTTY